MTTSARILTFFFPNYRNLACAIIWAVLGALTAGVSAAAESGGPVLTSKGNRFLLDGRDFKPWGIRVASGTADDQQCEHLIAQLDDYKAHGVNAVTVFYMGCRGRNYDPFSPDGRQIDPGHRQRMERIIQACAKRNMILVAGIFYQAAPFGLEDAEAVRQTVRSVATHLRPFRNVIINVCNEHNSDEWDKRAAVFDFREPERIMELCRIVHKVDPQRLVGGGGYDHKKNPITGRSKDVDVLLFDTAGDSISSSELYRRFEAEGVKNKPMINVETFGGWTKRFPRGVFPEAVKKSYFREVTDAIAEPGLSVFFHNNPWCQSQTEPMRYDLAGQGTQSDPGIRWYFEFVKTQTRTEPAVSSAGVGETNEKLPAKERFHLYLLIGQSNMAGRGKVSPEYSVSSERVLKFTKENTWAPGVEPLHFDKPTIAGVGLGTSFARVMADAAPDVTIGLIPCAVGGTPLERWYQGADLYEQAVARARLAMKDGALKGILWHQGESDSGTEAKARSYGERLAKMVTALRADLGVGDVPFVAGKLGEFLKSDTKTGVPSYWPVVNEQIGTLPQRVPRAAVVESKGLNHKGDNLHFDAPSLREFGKRYAEAMQKLQKEK